LERASQSNAETHATYIANLLTMEITSSPPNSAMILCGYGDHVVTLIRERQVIWSHHAPLDRQETDRRFRLNYHSVVGYENGCGVAASRTSSYIYNVWRSHGPHDHPEATAARALCAPRMIEERPCYSHRPDSLSKRRNATITLVAELEVIRPMSRRMGVAHVVECIRISRKFESLTRSETRTDRLSVYESANHFRLV